MLCWIQTLCKSEAGAESLEPIRVLKSCLCQAGTKEPQKKVNNKEETKKKELIKNGHQN